MNKVIYHGGCTDGWCAAWIAAHALGIGEENLIRASYGSKLPYDKIGPQDTVYLVDFSYPRAELLELATLVGKVIVLDHHKTAQAELADLHGNMLGIEVVFDMNRSGARIVYDELLVKGQRSLGSPAASLRSSWAQVMDIVSRYVQDRDLWQWKLHLSREVSAYLASLPFTMDGWNMLLHTDWTDVERGGLAIQRYIERKTDELVRPSRFMLADIGAFHGVALTNICIGAPGSEVLDVLCVDRPFACGWSQNGDGSYYYSLRSNGSDVDVGAFARSMRDRGTAFAGGGHAKAAGFSSRHRPDELFFNMREVPRASDDDLMTVIDVLRQRGDDEYDHEAARLIEELGKLRGPNFCHEDGCPEKPVIRVSYQLERGPMWWSLCAKHYTEGLQVVKTFLDEMVKRGKL